MLQSTGAKEYCMILQHPYYYQTIADMATTEDTNSQKTYAGTSILQVGSGTSASLARELSVNL